MDLLSVHLFGFGAFGMDGYGMHASVSSLCCSVLAIRCVRFFQYKSM